MPTAATHAAFYRRPVFRAASCAIIMIAVSNGFSSRSLAQRMDDQSMLRLSTRVLPEYTPEGIRAGDFILFPSLTTAGGYTDNVYNTDSSRRSDRFASASPRMELKSDFARHALNAALFVERKLYARTPKENSTDYGGSLSGKIDVTGNSFVPLSFSYKRDHYDRSIEEERSGTTPTVFDLFETSGGVVHQGSHAAFKALGSVRRYIFKNSGAPSNFIKTDNSDRDRSEYGFYASLGIREDRLFAPFIYTNVRKIQYDHKRDNNGFNRSSAVREAGLGSVVNISDITKVSFNAGHINRSTSDSRLSNKDGLVYGLNLSWDPSPLTSVLLRASRGVSETISPSSPSVTYSDVNLSMNYELFPNLLIQPSAAYRKSDYDNIERTVERFSAGFDAIYKVNPSAWLTSSYQHANIIEDGADKVYGDRSKNTYMISLRMQF
ncbi:MAG: hypothetical protein DI626_02225 [Micavibrio aeruginosavorus]|uniref:Outer membrane beta-barrel domain protein n=1 Tax=Micavibrio aeruginosavorus TaxID=349221 RepID=A0A2W5A0X5_9BACT|nr:MAG: hypothetical protein DI626_02225 [Micavibrio aeruginosavorus]